MTIDRFSRWSYSLLLGFAVIGASSCAPPPRPGIVYAQRHPPMDRAEERGRPPGQGYIWIRGHWRWDRDEFKWVRGEWADAGRRRWVEGHWAHDRRGWYWQDGYWRGGR
ncbi:MAG: hypothetical protein ABI647_16570 [Gemmatimonadota bacterium]